MKYEIIENNLHLVFEVTEEGELLLLHLGDREFEEGTIAPDAKFRYRAFELQLAGYHQDDHHGIKYTGCYPGYLFRYVRHADYQNEQGRKIEFVLSYESMEAVLHYQFFDGIKAVRCWCDFTNSSTEAVTITYLSSFALYGISKEGKEDWDKKSRVYIPHNGWKSEFVWQSYTTTELGLPNLDEFALSRIAMDVCGTFSTLPYVPMGIYENEATGSMLYWQIEHNGSWHSEISSMKNELYLQLSGPTENESHWAKTVKPGESFTTVPVMAGRCTGTLTEAAREMTAYRRAIRRKHEDNEKLPVIFNDYMNCLFGDPTTEKLKPLIEAAAEAGCEYFCIDCGWYSDGEWWNGVGQWLPAEKRFPGGIKEVIDYIKAHGMKAGLWLEIEVMGIKCPLVGQFMEHNCFFRRHGKPVIDHGRYQLDFRNKMVQQHATETIDRLVQEYGISYIKMDYNINGGIGTEQDTDSAGDGLLEHNRAYLAWLDEILDKYPDLVIENCGSGGLRANYALLSRLPIQSTSDNCDYLHYAYMAANAPLCVTGEQAAVWSYPLTEGDEDETVFNMVNSMLLRIHQSGHLVNLSSERFGLVKEGIAYYKTIREDIKTGYPFWPLGLAKPKTGSVCLGLQGESRQYIAAWSIDAKPMEIPLDKGKTVKCIYPSKANCDYTYDAPTGCLTLTPHRAKTARIFEVE